ncbi:MAG TPA: hypothetical protein DHV85_05640 [Candidatus Accumulibacter sp.]|nr:hypothetical protein [Accumulibacter sp.]
MRSIGNESDRLAEEKTVSTHDHTDNRRSSADGSRRHFWWVFGGFAALSLILLAVEHRTHLLSWLPPWWPWLFLLACPLMHVFMHGSHNAQGGTSNKVDDK